MVREREREREREIEREKRTRFANGCVPLNYYRKCWSECLSVRER